MSIQFQKLIKKSSANVAIIADKLSIKVTLDKKLKKQ